MGAALFAVEDELPDHMDQQWPGRRGRRPQIAEDGLRIGGIDQVHDVDGRPRADERGRRYRGQTGEGVDLLNGPYPSTGWSNGYQQRATASGALVHHPANDHGSTVSAARDHGITPRDPPPFR
ncbi:hypothetical protein GCM10012280_22910 [Wenjunlia tyrosinilytica]|uniref:Uncharacterized protein n=1 Tax=Wenjunlia tyrosinilytica TaxID=1544741 RepID=A0A917ZMF0_9ACTN|nr:hypothetical protein GCM10012280_22910 [Wenjunlia tyrosinilytica]